eukprot:1153384-Pelagomonas_calceolata.AAC.3
MLVEAKLLYCGSEARGSKVCMPMPEERKQKKDPQVHATVWKRQTSHINPVTTTAWNQHLQSHFLIQPTVVPQEGGHGCSIRTARLTCLSGKDMAVPSGRNHLPPEVLLGQGAESRWFPQPDCLETPSTAVLEGMVGSHIKKLRAGTEALDLPGLSGVPIPFLKYACLPVERGRKVDYVNVLVPLIARMFRDDRMFNRIVFRGLRLPRLSLPPWPATLGPSAAHCHAFTTSPGN